MLRLRARHRALATTREAWTKGQFVEALGAHGVDRLVADFVWDALLPFYHASLVPYPDDSIDDLLKIDPEDMEDIAAAFWAGAELPVPSATHPTTIPGRLTVTGFAQWLDAQARDAGLTG